MAYIKKCQFVDSIRQEQKKSCRKLLRRRPVTEVVNRQDRLILNRPTCVGNNFRLKNTKKMKYFSDPIKDELFLTVFCLTNRQVSDQA